MKRGVIFLVIGLLVGFPISLGGTQGQGGEDLHINGARADPEQQEAVGVASPEPEAGTTAWVRRYNGPGNDADEATAIAVDGQGNAYVTGSSWGSGTCEDYATIKYDTNGNRKWVRRYNGPGNGDDNARAIAVDGQGNVYVTGCSRGSDADDYATIKYDTNGNRKWLRRYNGPANSPDEATALAVDGQGNVYVTGLSWGSGTGQDYATIKYDTNGNRKWVRRYNGPGNGYDNARAIAVDSQGNVYVTGYSFWGSGTGEDYATIKYDTNGNRKWVRRYNGPGNSVDVAKAIAVDGLGNVYVTGDSMGSGTHYDYATIKYDTNGNRKWVRRYNGPGNYPYYDWPNAITVDSQGNVYVTGDSVGSGTHYDYATIKYDTNGNRKWLRRYNGPGNGYDDARAIAVDGQGNVYVTGGLVGSGTSYDYATIKYDTNGNRKWLRRYNGPGNSDDRAYALALDGQGNVYVTGGSQGSGTGFDYATIKYLP